MTPADLAPRYSSSALQDAVELALGADGALASIDPNHAERAVQRDMALAIAAAIEDRSALVVEAGTGVGKTFAYLVPALLSGARTLLSTATKTLQDQLFVRDLPRLRTALNLPVTVALRPEKIRVGAEPPEPEPGVPAGEFNRVSGTVRDMAYFGSFTVYHLQLASGRVLKISQGNTERHGASLTWDDKAWASWSSLAQVVLTQ